VSDISKFILNVQVTVGWTLVDRLHVDAALTPGDLLCERSGGVGPGSPLFLGHAFHVEKADRSPFDRTGGLRWHPEHTGRPDFSAPPVMEMLR